MVLVPEKEIETLSYRTGEFDHLIKDDTFIASKLRYMPLEAERLCLIETGWKKTCLGEGFIRYGKEETESDGTVYGWTLEKNEHERSCPVWILAKT